MNKWQQDVALFMAEVKGFTAPPTVVVPDYEAVELCRRLLIEESNETLVALSHLRENRIPVDFGIAEMADGLADTIYVCLYTANRFGIDLQPIWDAVQEANMAKKGGSMDAFGKVLKPAGWRPPDHVPEIARQMREESPT